jgi:serine/threonine-protein kinase HipA
MPSRNNASLEIFMNGYLVGCLHSSAQGVLSFRYDKSWLDFDNRRPLSLSMPLRSQSYSGAIVENYFDNLLPDSLAIRSRLQARVGAETTRCFDLLSYIGRDCVGALQLVPEGAPVDIRKITATPLSDDEISAILQSYRTMPLGVNIEEDFRISVAGAQEKTAFLKQNNRWCRPSGTTPTSHIFKLPIGELGNTGINLENSIENEWLCLELLADFGIPVASSEVLQFDEQRVLVVERFDRRWAKDKSWLMRLPQEDMCQATGVSGNLKYETDGGPGMRMIMDILLGSERSYEDRRVFMMTQLLFWMLAAIDGHAKNFSIFHLQRGLFRMTPLYDVISVHPLVASGQLAAQRVHMAMSVHSKNRHYRRDKIVRRHWLEAARKCRFSAGEMVTIIEECCDSVDGAIERVAARTPGGFPELVASAIFTGLRSSRESLVRQKE